MTMNSSAEERALSRRRDSERLVKELARRQRDEVNADEATMRLAQIIRTGADEVATAAAKVLLQAAGRLRGQESMAGADAFRELLKDIGTRNVRKVQNRDSAAQHIDVVAQPIAAGQAPTSAAPGAGGDARSDAREVTHLDPSPNFSTIGSESSASGDAHETVNGAGDDRQSCSRRGDSPNFCETGSGSAGEVKGGDAAVVAAPVRVVEVEDEDGEQHRGGGSVRVGKYFGEAEDTEEAREEARVNAVVNEVAVLSVEARRKLAKRLMREFEPKKVRVRTERDKEKARERARRSNERKRAEKEGGDGQG